MENPSSPYVRFARAAVDIHLCRVDLDRFQAVWLPALGGADRRRPSVAIEADSPAAGLLHPAELETVNRMAALKRQVEWLAGRYAVKMLAAAYLTECPAFAIRVAREAGGAPFLPAFPEHGVSITHAGRFAVAALGLDPLISMGIDLERLPIPSDEAFIELAFSGRERAGLDPSDPESLARAWTLKEAYLKYIRRGFDQSLHRVEFLDGVMLAEGRAAPVHWTVTAPAKNYRLSVVWGPACR